MKLHYFNCPELMPFDFKLAMAKGQGYVPQTCLASGSLVMSEVMEMRDPCAGCNGDRTICKGRSKSKGSPDDPPVQAS